MAATAYAPAKAVAAPKTAAEVKQFNAQATSQHQIVEGLKICIAQYIERMVGGWGSDKIATLLAGSEVPHDVYDLVNRYGIVPPPETSYSCIFFTFRLKEEPRPALRKGKRISVPCLFIDTVQMTRAAYNIQATQG